MLLNVEFMCNHLKSLAISCYSINKLLNLNQIQCHSKLNNILKEKLEKVLEDKTEIDIDQKVIDIVSDYAYSVTKRKPMVIPVTHIL